MGSVHITHGRKSSPYIIWGGGEARMKETTRKTWMSVEDLMWFLSSEEKYVSEEHVASILRSQEVAKQYTSLKPSTFS
jgi:hypothetical protein